MSHGRDAGTAPKRKVFRVPRSIQKRTAELERRVRERAEAVKQVLREYRETMRASSTAAKGRPTGRARLNRKRQDVERANAEYMQLQKELDRLRDQSQARK